MNSTFAIGSSSQPRPGWKGEIAGIPLIGLAALALRAQRLDWQPLWWDEGYSVYFATEPLARMVALTAQDIHPPLYYALLHGWVTLLGNANPVGLRSLSILIGGLAVPGIWWLARVLWPAHPRIAWLATFLLALNPMHLFYSQEVRMYGLVMLLGLASTGLFWCMMQSQDLGRPSLPDGLSVPARNRLLWLAVGYCLASLGVLYTEYLAGLLLIGHVGWAMWAYWRQWHGLRAFAWSYAVIGAGFLPWVFYAVPQLVPYVEQKVQADSDTALGLAQYVGRHVLAFTAGHVPSPTALAQGPHLAGVAGVGLLMALAVGRWWHGKRYAATPAARDVSRRSATGLLVAILLVSTTGGFLVNLRFPFFPEGGERVLFFSLPYFLLLLSLAADDALRWLSRWAPMFVGAGVGGLLTAAAAGVFAFYTVPRYTGNDYRPLIGQVVQQGTDQDVVLAVYPWQVGYWRAYAPVFGGDGERHGPWPLLSPSPAWNDEVVGGLEAALARGTVWFPAHLSLGGILEEQIEGYLRQRATNVANRWYGAETRLSGWSSGPTYVPVRPAGSVFGPVTLVEAGAWPETIASANQVLHVQLVWQEEGDWGNEFRGTLRLEDEDGRRWASRDYEPLGAYTLPRSADGMAFVERVGLVVPAGLPPGRYRLGIGVSKIGEDTLLAPIGREDVGASGQWPVATVVIEEPPSPVSPLRLPIQIPLQPPVMRGGVAFLGYAGYEAQDPPLAGEPLRLTLFFRKQEVDGIRHNLYVSLLDESGAGVAGWSGWTLPEYPVDAWPAAALVRVPVSFDLPAGVSAGRYRLVAGWQDPADGKKGPPVELSEVRIARRIGNFVAPSPDYPLARPVQFGTHVRLIGYDLASPSGQVTVELTLYWEALQPLLPPHHVFVHLDGPDGTTLAQDDGVPGGSAGRAPSGSWMPHEIIDDSHRLELPDSLPAEAVLRVGLYVPENGRRLEASVDGVVIGDVAILPLDLPADD